mgnify:CR=1 FL=1
MIYFMSRLKIFLSLLFNDSKEKKMINFFSHRNKKNENTKTKKILVTVIDDYYWLCRIASAKENEFKDYKLIGYWPIFLEPKTSSHNKLVYFIRNILRPIHYYF